LAPLVGQVEQALAPVLRARLLQNIAAVDELLQNTCETLLGNLEDIKEIGHPQARVPVHEVKNAVMCPAEAELREDGVRLAGEVAIGEEQQLDELDELVRGDLSGRPGR